MSKKIRLDILMTDQGLAPSREKAKALIMAGAVLVDGERWTRPVPRWRRLPILKSPAVSFLM